MWAARGEARRCAGADSGSLREHEALLETLNGVNTALLNSDDSNAQQESMIVAQAGMLGHITVATNMAGRGTDILLGGDPAQLSLLLLAHPYSGHFIAAYAASGSAASTGSAESNAAQKLQVRVHGLLGCTAPTASSVLSGREPLSQSQYWRVPGADCWFGGCPDSVSCPLCTTATW